MSGDVIAMLVGLVAVLFLATRNLQSFSMPFEKKAAMAAAWVVIIAVLAFAISRLAA